MTGRLVAHTREVPDRDPLDAFAAFPGERFYWERPSARTAIACRGSVAQIGAEGPDRLARLDREARALLERVTRSGDDARAPAGPRLVGGFAFDAVRRRRRRSADRAGDDCWSDFPNARFVLPELSLVRLDGRCFATLCAPATDRIDAAALDARLARALDAERVRRPAGGVTARFRAEADRPAADFLARVEDALDTIARGDLEKLVLARSVAVEGHEPFDPTALLSVLREAHPACASFAVARGDSVFLGATPERLLALDGRRVETAALAGTAPRGRSPEEDARLARTLVESKKEQAEHAIVVRALRGVLAPRCVRLSHPEAPRLLRLDGIQHLETPMHGVLAEPEGLLALAGALHPTPAVGGAPRDAAVAWLARHEPLERGWYGGGIGHLGADDGELVVALRAALLRGARAWCLAGAGIVPGSSPEAELRETRLKLRALLSPLMEL